MRLVETNKRPPAPKLITKAGKLFDPFDKNYISDPYPTLAKIQQSEPVFYSPKIDTWVVTRYETIREMLGDPDRFSAAVASDPLTPLCSEAKKIITNSDFDVPPVLVNNDGDSHPRCRRFFGEPIKPDRLASFKPLVENIVEEEIERMFAKGFPADLATGLTWEVPVLVLFHLLGIPKEDISKVKEYADSRVILLWGHPTDDEQIRLTKGAVKFFHYTKELVEMRLKNPQDDYPSQVLNARNGDDNIASMKEIIAVAFNFLFAGHETTSSASANIFKNILSYPEIWQQVVEGSLSVPKLIEEGLRYDPPVQAWRRMAKEDVILDGVEIPAGSHILMHFAAANRDPEMFENPAKFDPTRSNARRHISFGLGTHFCLGAPLARMQISVMIQKLAERFPGVRLAENYSPQYLPNTSFRGVRNVPVEW